MSAMSPGRSGRAIRHFLLPISTRIVPSGISHHPHAVYSHDGIKRFAGECLDERNVVPPSFANGDQPSLLDGQGEAYRILLQDSALAVERHHLRLRERRTRPLERNPLQRHAPRVHEREANAASMKHEHRAIAAYRHVFHVQDRQKHAVRLRVVVVRDVVVQVRRRAKVVLALRKAQRRTALHHREHLRSTVCVATWLKRQGAFPNGKRTATSHHGHQEAADGWTSFFIFYHKLVSWLG